MSEDQREDHEIHIGFQDAMLKWIFGLVASAIVGGVIWAWQLDRLVTSLTQQMVQLQLDRGFLRQADRDHGAEVSDLQARTRVLEAQMERQDERMLSINGSLVRLEQTVRDAMQEVRAAMESLDDHQ